MSKVDKKLDAAKCTIYSVKDFERSLNVVSVARVHDEVEVTFKRNDGKHIFPIMYGQEESSYGVIPVEYDDDIRNLLR